MKNVSNYLRFCILLSLFFSISETAKADSLDVIVIWQTSADPAANLSLLHGRQLDYSAPSNARLIRIPFSGGFTTITGYHSYSGMSGAVGVIQHELGSVGTGANYVVSIPVGDNHEAPSITPLPTNLFSCETQSPIMTSTINCGTGVNAVRIAILDSGIDEKNTLLMSKVDLTNDILDGSVSVKDLNGHGTNCSGIVYRYLVDNNSKMQIYKILDKNGQGKVWHLIKAIDAAVTNGSKIISMSVVAYPLGNTSSDPTPLSIAINKAQLNNVLVFAAAGNGVPNGKNIDDPAYHAVPAGEPNDNIISVGSMIGCTNLTTPSVFSNWGQNDVDIFTYGEDILTWNHLGEVENVSGTSYSTVLAACVALQIWSKVPIANRNFITLKDAIIFSATLQPSLAIKCVSRGILNAPAASCLLLNNCPVLPIELTTFAARLNGNTVQLEWRASIEQHISHYEIEGSPDGKVFTYIASQKAHGGNQSATYYYQDMTPLQGTQYYRLKIVETNGTFSYSKTVAIDTYTKKENGLEVYPNPFSSVLHFKWQGIKAQNSIVIKLMDNIGRWVWSSEVKNTEGVINQYQLPNLNLSSGIYWLQLGNQIPQRLIKQ